MYRKNHYLRKILAIISSVALFSYPLSAFADNTCQTTADTGGQASYGTATGIQQLAQTFTAAQSGKVTTVVAVTAKQGSPTDNLYFTLETVDGSNLPTGTVLDTSTNVAGSGLATYPSNTNATFTFSANSVTNGTVYALVEHRDGSLSDTNNYADFGGTATGCSTHGEPRNSGSGWVANTNTWNVTITIIDAAPVVALNFSRTNIIMFGF